MSKCGGVAGAKAKLHWRAPPSSDSRSAGWQPAMGPRSPSPLCLCRSFYCLSAGYHRARSDLRRSTRPASAVLAAAKPPVRQKLEESGEYLEHYVGAMKVSPGLCPSRRTHGHRGCTATQHSAATLESLA